MTIPDSPHLGRFIVKTPGATHRFLAAHQVLEMIDAEEPFEQILRVHRVFDDGRMDLVGVTPDSLRSRDGLMLLWNDVKSARRDYDAILECAGRQPPPCRIEFQLAHSKDYGDASHVVSLVFPEACGEGVGQWMNAVGFKSDARIDASPHHLVRFESAISQVILSTLLEPATAAE